MKWTSSAGCATFQAEPAHLAPLQMAGQKPPAGTPAGMMTAPPRGKTCEDSGRRREAALHEVSKQARCERQGRGRQNIWKYQHAGHKGPRASKRKPEQIDAWGAVTSFDREIGPTISKLTNDHTISIQCPQSFPEFPSVFSFVFPQCFPSFSLRVSCRGHPISFGRISEEQHRM